MAECFVRKVSDRSEPPHPLATGLTSTIFARLLLSCFLADFNLLQPIIQAKIDKLVVFAFKLVNIESSETILEGRAKVSERR